MKRTFFALLILALLVSLSVCSADTDSDTQALNELFSAKYRSYDAARAQTGKPELTLPSPQEVWPDGGNLVLALFNIFSDQTENSLASAQAGEDYRGIPNELLAKDLESAETVIFLQQVSVSSTGKTGKQYYIYARLLFTDPHSDELPAAAVTEPVYLTEAEKEAMNMMTVQSCTDFLAGFTDRLTHPDGWKERYDEAMALYNDEKYYSARQAFIESEYGNWEEMAAKCIRRVPAAGELWHDPNIWVKDMSLTFRIDQPEDTSIFIRIYKDGKPISYVIVPGPGEATAELPGNGYYTIKDGIGTEWYGVKEAFGPDGSYETMTFDEAGTEKVYLESYYEYTISINVGGGGTGIGSKDENWENFAEEQQ